MATFYQGKLAAGYAPAGVNKLHVTLHKALSQAVRWHMIPRNVCEAVSAPRPTADEMKTLSPPIRSGRSSRRLLATASKLCTCSPYTPGCARVSYWR